MKKTNHNSSTLKDVAARAGVSLASASRVLSNSDYPVSEAKKKRVFAAARELNYQPNIFARLLKGNDYNALGVIVPTLQNPFYNQVVQGIESVASKSNYEIMILSSHRSIEQERNNIHSLLQNRVMALLIISIDTNSDCLEEYICCGGKVALLEANFKLKNAIVTETDHVGAAQLAVEYLVSYGHRRIAFLSSPLTKMSRRSVMLGIREMMKEYHLPFSEDDIFLAAEEGEADNGLYEFEVGKSLADAFFPHLKKYTAIIAINDLTAFGIMQGLMQRQLSIPKDISVISLDNIIYSEMISPPLTTVALPSFNLGAATCRSLLNTLMYPNESCVELVFHFSGQLVERQSVADLRSVLIE